MVVFPNHPVVMDDMDDHQFMLKPMVTWGSMTSDDFRTPPMTPLVGAGSPTPATSPCAASPVNRA